ncbi:MAG: hypothetical protein SF052_16505 [Bacteroidia bacterium]|nr:hypothetical protein [Bacteroidia bacterium]
MVAKATGNRTPRYRSYRLKSEQKICRGRSTPVALATAEKRAVARHKG